MNGLKVSRNNFCHELEDNMLQIDVCEECFTSGCASGGYVEIINCDHFVIWKEPCTYYLDDYWKSHYTPAYGLKQGTIFWPKDLYSHYLNAFGSSLAEYKDIVQSDIIDVLQAKDLWRIYGSRCLHSTTIDSYELERLEEQFDFMYSEEFDHNGCHDFYIRAKEKWAKSHSAKIVSYPTDYNKIIVAFRTIKGYKEWDAIVYVGEKLYFPVGDCFAVELIEAD